MWILVPGFAPVSTMHWQRSAEPSPHSRCALTLAQGLSISRMRLTGWSVSGRWAPSSAEAGARNATIHAEAASAPVKTLRAIRAAGSRAGLAINPGTAVEPYAGLLTEIDMLLLMTVEPGFGGQHFLDLVLPKIRRARALVVGDGTAIWLQVDGGVTEETIGRCAEAGAGVFVAGSAGYEADDPAAGIRPLR